MSDLIRRLFALAKSYVFDKQSPEPILCDSLGLPFDTTFAHSIPVTLHGALLLPKLRSQFAEFLNVGSFERLRIFSLPTCVGLRYGHESYSLRSFSRQHGTYSINLLISVVLCASALSAYGFAYMQAYTPRHGLSNRAGIPSCVTPSINHIIHGADY